MTMISSLKYFFITILKILLVTADQNHEASLRPLISNDSKETCSLPLNDGYCTWGHSYGTRWYFNSLTNKCKVFNYYGCGGNTNNFNDSHACEKLCVKKATRDIYSLPRDTGDCWFGYGRWWYYDKLDNDCKFFWYSGCGGNDNRFESKLACTPQCFKNETTRSDLRPTNIRTDYNGFNIYPYNKKEINLNSKINGNSVSRSSFKVPVFTWSKPIIKFGSIFGAISASFAACIKIFKCWHSKKEKEPSGDNSEVQEI